MPRNSFFSGLPAQTQQDHRRQASATDTWGRRWALNLEIRTGDPCGTVGRIGWDDPLATPQPFIHIGTDQYGNKNPTVVNVDFDGWIAQQEDAMRVWRQQLVIVAQKAYPSGFDPRRIFEDPYLVEQAGPKPWPSVAVLRAAKEGHAGFLGLRPLTPAERQLLAPPVRRMADDLAAAEAEAIAQQVVAQLEAEPAPETYQAFVSWAIKTGRAKDMSGAAKLWGERKQPQGV